MLDVHYLQRAHLKYSLRKPIFIRPWKDSQACILHILRKQQNVIQLAMARGSDEQSCRLLVQILNLLSLSSNTRGPFTFSFERHANGGGQENVFQEVPARDMGSDVQLKKYLLAPSSTSYLQFTRLQT